eukprot:671333-Prorocentrum_lima.AAC.1
MCPVNAGRASLDPFPFRCALLLARGRCLAKALACLPACLLAFECHCFLHFGPVSYTHLRAHETRRHL